MAARKRPQMAVVRYGEGRAGNSGGSMAEKGMAVKCAVVF